MGFLKWLVESLGSRNDKVNGDAEDENDVNNSKSVEETHHYVNSNLRRQGFSVSAQVPVDRADQTGPILVPSSPGDGGVQISDLPLEKQQPAPYSSIPSSSSSSYTCFSDQAVREGLWSGTSVGGGHGGVEITQGSVDMREAVQGFSVSAQVPVDRADQIGPILVPSSPGDGGVQTSDLPLKKQPAPYSSIPSSSSSSYTCFSDQAVREGLWSGTSVGGGQGGVEITQGSVDMREAVQRELEKEKIREEILAEEIAKIREEILAEEIARRCVLEAEVRTELIERGMTKMQIGEGFPLSTMLGPQSSHNTLFESELPRGQPFAPVDGRIATSFDEKYGGSGLHGREIRGFEVDPSQQLPRSSEDAKNKVIDLGMPNGATVSGAKQKQPSSAAAGSSKLSSYISKNQTEKWSCAVCKFSATCENNFNQHLAGKKHQAKISTLKGHKYGAKIGLGVACEKPATKKSAKTQPPMIKTSTKCVSIPLSAKKPEEWRVVAPCERGLKEHLAGTKHQNKVIDLVKSNGATASVAKQKPPSPPPPPPPPAAAAGGLNEISSDGLKKKTGWACAICDISISCENNFYDHLAGKKHQANVANLKPHNTFLKNKLSEKTQPSLIMNSSNCVSIPPALEGLKAKTEKWMCAVCKIYAGCEYDSNAHLAGKKHRAKVAALRAQYENLLV